MGRIKDFIDAFKVKHEEVYSKGVMLQVVENDKVRMFKLDGATNSIINKKSIYTGGYWDYLIPLAYAYKNPKVLIIGLGIGTTVYQFRSLFKDKLSIDVVEIDKEVVKLARKYAPEKIRAKIIVKDGYDYVAKTGKKYDILVLDAYGKGALIPKQFFDRGFVSNASRILNAKGVMAINYAMHPSGILRFGGYKKLLRRFFRVYSIRTTSLGDTQLILCSKQMGKEELLKKAGAKIKMNAANSTLIEGYEKMRSL